QYQRKFRIALRFPSGEVEIPATAQNLARNSANPLSNKEHPHVREKLPLYLMQFSYTHEYWEALIKKPEDGSKHIEN
ncbi:MAG: hypothetical protein JRN67_11235, partial [Nitrososphaerota archaeon]|nr:hypothetical protein [Nitrososphaerota archaeon]